MTKPINRYFVVFQNFGDLGLEANVHPEETRSDIVKMLASGEFKNVICIHYVCDGVVSDVTRELFTAAQVDRMDAASEAAEWLELA